MDAVLLLVECVAIILVLRWVTNGNGAAGLIGWKEAAGKGETQAPAAGPASPGPAPAQTRARRAVRRR